MLPSRRRRVLAPALVALLTLFAIPAVVAAHAEFESSTPADGATVVGPPDQVVATFSEELATDSKLEIKDASGSTVATGEPDGERLVADTADLGPGAYVAQWTSIADDGHVERGEFSFTVTAPTPSPTATASATPAAPSATGTALPPSPSAAAATPSPSASADGSATAAGGNTLLPIVAGLVIVAALAAYLFRRRSAGRP